METKLGFRKVGRYLIQQEDKQDVCCLCKNANWGTIIVQTKKMGEEGYDYHKGVCIECILKILKKTEEYASLLETGLSSYEARETVWGDANDRLYYPSILGYLQEEK